METRILIPPSLTLVLPPCSETKIPKTEKLSKSQISKESEDSGEEEPTSSSGLLETNDLSSINNSSENSHSNSEEETDETEKISKSSPSSSSESDLEIEENDSKNEPLIGSSANSRKSVKRTRRNSNKKRKTCKSSSNSYKNKLRNRKPSKISKVSEDLLPKGVTLCAKETIEKGTKFGPNDGEIRILFLDQVPHLSSHDIRFVFGCFDRVTEDPLDDEKEIRLCNWIRFLHAESNPENITTPDKNSLTDDPNITPKCSSNNKRVNLIARFVDGKPQFEFIKRVDPGTELVVFFDIESITQSNSLSTADKTTRSKHHNIYTSSNHHNEHDEYGDDLKFDTFPNSNNSSNISTQLNHFYSYMKMKNELDSKQSAVSGDGPLDLSKSLSSTSSTPLKLPSSLKIKTETPFESPESQESFPSVFDTPTPKSHLFSISNVLQPGKIFQPYSLPSHPHTLNDTQPSQLFQFQRSTQNLPSPSSNSTTNLQMVNSSSLAKTPISIRSSSSTSTSLSPMRNQSPRRNNSPVLIRPILRTRGRERSLLPCEVCGKAFDRPSLLKRHMRTHTGEKPHICDVCSKGFSTSSSLNTHRRIHSGEKPHQCPICGKRFTASSNLYYHRMTHNKEKPHKCILCGKSFPTPGDLKSHQYVHSGSWPYNCPICHRGFSKQTNLRNHLLLHSGDKPHNCHICGKKFALACNLRAHLRTHEEEPVSSCISCNRSFLTSLNMLVNGHCRSCLLTSNKPPSSSSSSELSRLQSSSTTNSCNNPRRSSSNNSNQSQSLLTPLNSLSVMPTPASNPLSTLQGFHLPVPGNPGGTIGIGNLASLFPPGSLSSTAAATPPTTNPFLEQLFQWNYRFAKETAGNLSIMQQKLLESQMLAAHLMIGSSNTPNFGMGISDLLRIRPQDFNGVDLNKFIQQ